MKSAGARKLRELVRQRRVISDTTMSSQTFEYMTMESTTWAPSTQNLQAATVASACPSCLPSNSQHVSPSNGGFEEFAPIVVHRKCF